MTWKIIGNRGNSGSPSVITLACKGTQLVIKILTFNRNYLVKMLTRVLSLAKIYFKRLKRGKFFINHKPEQSQNDKLEFSSG